MEQPHVQAHPPSTAFSFEVIVYNRDVRAMLKENAQHDEVDERWANPTRQVVEAKTLDEARRLAADRYPAEQGFVITSVTAIARPGRAQ